MKKIRCLAALCALMILLPMSAIAARGAVGAMDEETAADLTARCRMTFAPGSKGRDTLKDGSYLTYYTGKYLEIAAPESQPCFGVFLHFAGREAPYRVERLSDTGAWECVSEDNRRYANAYLPLPGLTDFRIVPSDGTEISIAEIALLGDGDLPGWVQDWRPFEGKADLMVLSAHADDELLFFGGVIPYYGAEAGKRVIVCYLTDQTSCRRNELLDGLWVCGVREYPDMGFFKDIKNDSLGDSYGFWGEQPVVDYVTALIRRYQPEVIVTHDLRGEYGHGAHRVCADAAAKAFEKAANAAYQPNLGEPWQAKKLYLHLYKENQIVFNWRQPLSAFHGRTAFDIAKAAFDCHASQKSNGLIVEDSGPYANNRFGLYLTTVGLDEAPDFFNHIAP